LISPELELERRAHELRGQTLRAVWYQHGKESGEVDSIQHLAFLDFESGGRVAIGCSDELRYRHGWGITVRSQNVIDTAYGTPVDMSKSRWAPRMGKTIAHARIHWDGIRDRLRSSLAVGVAIHADHLSRHDYPQTLELDFGGGDSVFFAAARRSREGTVAFVNELLVFFSQADREAAGL
jgi:hypothetical protein